MKVKIIQDCRLATLPHERQLSFKRGEEVDVSDNVGTMLIAYLHAHEIKEIEVASSQPANDPEIEIIQEPEVIVTITDNSVEKFDVDIIEEEPKEALIEKEDVMEKSDPEPLCVDEDENNGVLPEEPEESKRDDEVIVEKALAPDYENKSLTKKIGRLLSRKKSK